MLAKDAVPDVAAFSFEKVAEGVPGGTAAWTRWSCPAARPGTSRSASLLSWQLSGPVLDSTIQIAIVAFQEAFKPTRKLMGRSLIEYDLSALRLGKIFNP